MTGRNHLPFPGQPDDQGPAADMRRLAEQVERQQAARNELIGAAVFIALVAMTYLGGIAVTWVLWGWVAGALTLFVGLSTFSAGAVLSQYATPTRKAPRP